MTFDPYRYNLGMKFLTSEWHASYQTTDSKSRTLDDYEPLDRYREHLEKIRSELPVCLVEIYGETDILHDAHIHAVQQIGSDLKVQVLLALLYDPEASTKISAQPAELTYAGVEYLHYRMKDPNGGESDYSPHEIIYNEFDVLDDDLFSHTFLLRSYDELCICARSLLFSRGIAF